MLAASRETVPSHPAPRAPRIDPDVMDAARRGDEEGLRALATAIYPLVRRWLGGARLEREEADDLTQDVMVQVLRRLGSFRGESSFTTWLFRVTRNARLDRDKARRRRESRLKRVESAEAFDRPEAGPEAALRRRRVSHALRNAFLRLPERQREVFELADVMGFTSPEIARMLGTRPSTVRVNLLRARRALRSSLVESDPELAKEYEP